MLQKLRDMAIRDLCCGLSAVTERNTTLTPKSEVTVCAIVTNLVQHAKTAKALADSLSNGDVKRRSVNGTGTSRKRSRGHKRKSRS